MSFQYGSTLRNNQVAQIQSTVGSSAALVIYTGTQPGSCAASATGTTLVTMSLPNPFLSSTGGVATMSGSWSGTAVNPGVAGYFRILDGSLVCHVQGSTGLAGSGMDMILNNTTIATSGTVSVTTFSVTAGNS